MYFNPRGYVSLDGSWVPNIASGNNFNPRGYVSLDSTYDNIGTILAVFQSTRLRKPRRGNFLYCVSIIKFQSTRLRKPRQCCYFYFRLRPEFQSTRLRKPRLSPVQSMKDFCLFQSTRLRKPRRIKIRDCSFCDLFQSTRLRKPRQKYNVTAYFWDNFNPRGYVSLDWSFRKDGSSQKQFQSTRLRKPRQQKHSKKHNHLTPKYNSYTNISSHIYIISLQNIYVHNI